MLTITITVPAVFTTRHKDSQLDSATNPKTHELIHSVIEEHGALYLGLQKAHPVSCVLCPAWPDILGYYWEHIVQEGKRLIDQYQSGK